jgi:hypothetical protein
VQVGVEVQILAFCWTQEKLAINREYLTTRNRQQLAKAQSAEMALEERRGELISKEIVVRQAAFIFVSLRQAVLNFPSRYAYRILDIADPRQAKEVLAQAAHEFLSELAGFPERVIDPHWIESFEENGQEDKPLRPATGAEIKSEQAKARIRREKKAEAIRRSRSKKL